MARLSNDRAPPWKRAYLLAYNGGLAIGWLYVLLCLAYRASIQVEYLEIKWYAEKMSPLADHSLTFRLWFTPLPHLYPFVSAPVKVFQTLAALEIVHAATGLVRSPVGTAAVQVGSRLAMVWLCADVAPIARRNWGAGVMVTAWALVEVPRYLLYTMKLALDRPEARRGLNAGFLRRLYWVRYHAFIVLYPLGILGEIVTLVYTVSFCRANPAFRSVGMPNAWNAWFNYGTFAAAVGGLAYPLGAPLMYTHMCRQRARNAWRWRRRGGDGEDGRAGREAGSEAEMLPLRSPRATAD